MANLIEHLAVRLSSRKLSRRLRIAHAALGWGGKVGGAERGGGAGLGGGRRVHRDGGLRGGGGGGRAAHVAQQQRHAGRQRHQLQRSLVLSDLLRGTHLVRLWIRVRVRLGTPPAGSGRCWRCRHKTPLLTFSFRNNFFNLPIKYCNHNDMLLLLNLN